MNGGRPLRFLALVLGGWILARIAMLWPVTPLQSGVPVEAKTHSASAIKAMPGLRPSSIVDVLPAPSARAIRRDKHLFIAIRVTRVLPEGVPLTLVEAEAPPVTTTPEDTPDAFIPPPLRPRPIARARSRLAGSAWAIGHGGATSLPGGELGGSQAGVRATYALGDSRHFALSARFYTPLAGSGREAAVGVDWQPTRAPLHVIAEQRIGLDGQRGGPTLLLIGGINPKPIAAGFRIEAYAQAGAIARNGVEAFGDGAARLTRPLATVGNLKLDIGAGSWGAAQRHARRLDVGPTLGAAIPVAHTTARLTLDWRERVGGDALPGSGPAIALGTDF